MIRKNKIKIGLITFFSVVIIIIAVVAWDFGFLYIIPSKQKMYAEMDSLISIIERANPHLKIYEETMGYDVIEKIKEQREKIKDVKNIGDYSKIIYTSLRLIPEIHCSLIGAKEIEKGGFYLENYPEIFDKSTIRAYRRIGNAFIFNIIREEREYQKHHMGYTLYVSYIEGEYFISRPVKKINGNDTIEIKVGLKLTKINDTSVHEFLAKNRDEYVLVPVRWDFINKRLFTESIGFPYSYVRHKKPLYLTFVDTVTQQEMKVLYAGADGLKTHIDADHVLGEYRKYEDIKSVVRMIDNVLFIKILSMNIDDMPFYEEEISAVAKNQTIKKVIVDVRGNGGGSDYVWHHVLSLLTDTTLCIHAKMGLNDNPVFKNYFQESLDSFPLYYDTKLNKNYRLLSDDGCNNIEPHENSISYKGKIYVLHDKNSFSAANSFVTFAITNDKIVAVGEPTGVQSGYGVNPFVYKLPYTKLCFLMHSVIHFPPENSNDINDYLWNKTEIPVKSNIIYENIMEEYQSCDIYYKDFLYNYDIYFQEVMKDKE